MIKSPGRKRTSIPPKKDKADAQALHFKDMFVQIKTGEKFYFDRLRFIGVPTKKEISKGSSVTANRDKEIRSIYIESLKRNFRSLTVFNVGFVAYYRYLDEIGYSGDGFDLEVMLKSISHYNNQRRKGKDETKAMAIKNSLAWFLDAKGRRSDREKLPSVKAHGGSKRAGAFDIELELKPIGKALYRGFNGFVRHINAGTHPEIHPIYCEDTFNQRSLRENWSKREYADKAKSFKTCMVPLNAHIIESDLSFNELQLNALINQAGRNALYLFFMLTGMNPSVLEPMRRGDVRFKSIGRGRYIFDGIKGRAGHKEVDVALGFSGKTKYLIESWLNASKKLVEKKGIPVTQDLPLFPFFSHVNNSVRDFSSSGARGDVIEKRLSTLLGINVNPTRFRKTKSNILMRSTESLYIVSQGMNNSIDVVARSYSDGVQADHDNNLSATFSAQKMLAEGKALSSAVMESKVMHSDILSEYDYKQRLRSKQINIATLTPSGVRCTESHKVSASKEGSSISVQSTGSCTDFLSCYKCDKHKLVASVVDIWLMLSFYEQITSLKEQVSKNSTPKQDLLIAEATTSKTLERMKAKAPEIYRDAERRLEDEGLHPLYADRYYMQDYLEGSRDQ